MIQVGLLLRLEAKNGKETELEQFLKSGLNYVNDEVKTINWYAFRINESTFGIFDTFPDEDGRHAHHTGQLAQALMKAAPDLLAVNPSIETVDILAFKK